MDQRKKQRTTPPVKISKFSFSSGERVLDLSNSEVSTENEPESAESVSPDGLEWVEVGRQTPIDWLRAHIVLLSFLLIACIASAVIIAGIVVACVRSAQRRRRRYRDYAKTVTQVVDASASASGAGSTESLHVGGGGSDGELDDGRGDDEKTLMNMQTNGFENPINKLFEQHGHAHDGRHGPY